MQGSRIPVALEVESWRRLRKVVDRVVPVGVQEVLYNYLATLPKIGSQFYRPCDYGLIFMYWLIVDESFKTMAENCATPYY